MSGAFHPYLIDFLKFLPMVGIIARWKFWKYKLLTPSGSDYMAFLKKWQIHDRVGAQPKTAFS